MRRVLTFLEWKAKWWIDKRGRNLGVRPDIADGIRAYAAEQAHINRALARSFKMRWESAGRDHKQDEEGLADDSEYTREVGEYGFDTDLD